MTVAEAGARDADDPSRPILTMRTDQRGATRRMMETLFMSLFAVAVVVAVVAVALIAIGGFFGILGGLLAGIAAGLPEWRHLRRRR